MGDLRAYTVTLPHWIEEGGGTIFASSNIEARRIAADEWCDGEIGGLSVVRAPGLDRYQGSGVPAWIQVDSGWWFECHGCGMRINEDELSERGMRVENVVGTERGAVFCCVECRDEARARKAREDAAGEAFLAKLRALIRRKYGPEVGFEGVRDHVFAREEGGRVVIHQAIAEFTFPGMKISPASLRYEWGCMPDTPRIGPPAPRIYCCNGDREAFEAWASRPGSDA